MKQEVLERLLSESCDLLVAFKNEEKPSPEDKLRIQAIFDEIKYSDKIDEEVNFLLRVLNS